MISSYEQFFIEIYIISFKDDDLLELLEYIDERIKKLNE